MPRHGNLALAGLILCSVVFGQTPSSTTIIASPNPSNYGQPVTLTATVTSSATGKVTFYDGVTILGVGTLSGTQASITTVMLGSGIRKLRAYYQGDGTYAGSSSTIVPQTVAAGASLGLRHPISFPTPGVTSAIAVGDLNGDNKQDIVMVNPNSNSVTVYLGNGDGTFQAGVGYPVGSQPQSVVVADFNGDGFADLAVTSYSGIVNILLGNGDGTFQPALSSSVGSSLTAIAAGDFDGDGKADLVFADAFSNNVEIVLGKGDGTFGGTIFVSSGAPTTSVAVADFNGDGKADLVVTYQSPGNEGVLLGNGDGTFQSSVTQYLSPSLSSVITADFNGDGKPDIVVYAPSEQYPEGGFYGIFVMLGNGDGTFGTPAHYFPQFFSGSVVTEDFNGDGKPDLAVTDLWVSNGQLALMLGNGDGTFGNLEYYSLPTNLSVAAVGDFNGDGKPDLVITGPSGEAYVLLGGAVPDLSIAVSHGAGFTQGQQGAAYTITVTNVGDYPSSGLAQVAATLAAGLTPTGIAGTGWSCVLGTLTCTRTDPVGPQASYPAIVIAVNVESGSEASLTSTFTVSGGGESNLANDTATDTTLARYPTATALTAMPNPSALSQPVTFTATVTAGATGRVEFYAGGMLLGSASIAGNQSTFTTSLLPSGVSSLRAVYLGDPNYGWSSSAAQTQTVTAVVDNGLLPRQSYTLAAAPVWIATADLNGDGKMDLITANSVNSYTGSISVMLGNGDGTFRPAVNYASGNNPTSAVLGDFNNDGKLDVAVATSYGAFLLLGNGDGSFQTALSISSPIAYTALAAADFHRDGNLDLVALGSAGIFLYPGNGDGTFQPPVTLTSSSYILLAAADLNRDGKPDLIALNGNPSTLSVFLGNGDGTFQISSSSITLITPPGMVVGDFNGDGIPDLAVTGGILLGNGDGTFTAAPTSFLYFLSEYPAIAGDFNGDGKLDLVLANYSNANITLAFGNGDGTFQQGPTVPTDGYPCTLALADFNGDGKPDFAVANNSSSTVDIFLGGQISGLNISSQHNGRFTAGQTGTYQIAVTNFAFANSSGTVTVTDSLPTGLTATAIGGTGWTCTLSTLTCTRSGGLTGESSYPMIAITVTVAANLSPSVITNRASVSIGGVLNSATDPTTIVSPITTSLTVSPNPATLGQPVTLTATVTAGATGAVLFLDSAMSLGSAPVSNGQAILTTRLLQAGLRYLVATYAGDATHAPSSSAEIYETVNSLPANGFAAAASYATGTSPWGIAAGDFNNDGATDLVTTNYYANTVSILLGHGDGTFGPNVDYSVGPYPISVVVADFNNDGQPDIAVGYDYANFVSILLGNPNGTFQPARNFTPTYGSGTLAASDFNGDGKTDLAVFSSFTSSVSLLFGNGDGTFLPGPSFYVSGEAAVGDFNRDGKIDLFSCYEGVFLGNGDGSFQPPNYSGSSFDATFVIAGDLNGDGKPDIVAVDQYDTIFVLLGNGDGTFQNIVQYNSSGAITSLLLADMNGDGKLDVVATDNGENSLLVFQGNGDGTLQPATSIPLGSQPQSTVAGDFNGDGRTDLAIASYGNNSVAVLLGVPTPKLTISSSHADPFVIGQTGETYSISVTNTGPGVTSGTVSVTDTLPSGLTATAIQGTGWNCTLAPLTCTYPNTLSVGQSSSIIVSVTPTAIGTGANQVTVSGGGTASASASDPTTVVGPAITVQTVPSGLQFSIDNAAPQIAPQTINLAPGMHTIAVASTQTAPGTEYLFSSWSDSGMASRTITVGTSAATYTASFQTQYQLTTASYPQAGGSVTPASGTYYNAGANVTLTATPNSPLVFTGWSGGAASTSNPLQITVNAPVSVTATFDVPGPTCTMTGDGTPSVADVQFIVNEALGIVPANNDLNGDGVVNVADVQKVIVGVLKSGCIY